MSIVISDISLLSMLLPSPIPEIRVPAAVTDQDPSLPKTLPTTMLSDNGFQMDEVESCCTSDEEDEEETKKMKMKKKKDKDTEGDQNESTPAAGATPTATASASESVPSPSPSQLPLDPVATAESLRRSASTHASWIFPLDVLSYGLICERQLNASPAASSSLGTAPAASQHPTADGAASGAARPLLSTPPQKEEVILEEAFKRADAISPAFDMYKAASTNASALVNILNWKHNKNIHTRDPDQWTALHCAAFFGNASAVACLIRQGAQVNMKDKEGATPLHLAAAENKTEVIRILINNGAAINAVDSYGRTPLMRALLATGTKEAVALLLSLNASIKHKDVFGYTTVDLCLLPATPKQNADVIHAKHPTAFPASYTPLGLSEAAGTTGSGAGSASSASPPSAFSTPAAANAQSHSDAKKSSKAASSATSGPSKPLHSESSASPGAKSSASTPSSAPTPSSTESPKSLDARRPKGEAKTPAKTDAASSTVSPPAQSLSSSSHTSGGSGGGSSKGDASGDGRKTSGKSGGNNSNSSGNGNSSGNNSSNGTDADNASFMAENQQYFANHMYGRIVYEYSLKQPKVAFPFAFKNLNLQDVNSGYTAHHYAVILGGANMVWQIANLLTLGCSSNIRTHRGAHPLHLLAMQPPDPKHPHLVTAACALLVAVADYHDVQDENGYTALMYASAMNNAAFACAFLSIRRHHRDLEMPRFMVDFVHGLIAKAKSLHASYRSSYPEITDHPDFPSNVIAMHGVKLACMPALPKKRITSEDVEDARAELLSLETVRLPISKRVEAAQRTVEGIEEAVAKARDALAALESEVGSAGARKSPLFAEKLAKARECLNQLRKANEATN